MEKGGAVKGKGGRAEGRGRRKVRKAIGWGKRGRDGIREKGRAREGGKHTPSFLQHPAPSLDYLEISLEPR
jgi:hypothetical protein